jgi:hypothetical protein
MRYPVIVPVRFWADRDDTVLIRYYWVPEGTPYVPVSGPFQTRTIFKDDEVNWHSGGVFPAVCGETYTGTRKRTKGESPAWAIPLPTGHFCGSERAWRGEGVFALDPPLTKSIDGIPVCCGSFVIEPAAVCRSRCLNGGTLDATLTDGGSTYLAFLDRVVLAVGSFRLFTDNITPNFATTLAALHECSFPGYAAQQPPWSVPQLTDDGCAKIDGTQATFSRNAGPGPSQRAYLWGFTVADQLLWVQRIQGAPITFQFAGDSYRLFPVTYETCRCPGDARPGRVGVRGGLGIGANVSPLGFNETPVAGGLGIGGNGRLAGLGLLLGAGGAGVGGSDRLSGVGRTSISGGLGIGGTAGMEGGDQLSVAGGLGIGGSLTEEGVGRQGVSGGVGVGSVVALNGGNIYALINTFTAPNGTTLAAYVPNVGPSWTQVMGSATIQSNKLAMGSGGFGVQDSGLSNYTMTVDVTAQAGATQEVVFRYSNSSNYWFAQLTTVGLVMVKVVAGSLILVQNTPHVFVSGTTYNMSVVLAGNALHATADGITVGTGADAFNNTATKVGLQSLGSGGVFDNLYLK